jgi:hypothetical protein
MASIAPDLLVTLLPGHGLRFPPRPGGVLAIAVSPQALRSPTNTLTQVVRVENDGITWVGALDEKLLKLVPGQLPNCRDRLCSLLFQGERTWKVILPGELRQPDSRIRDTVYRGSRPWLVLAGPGPFGILAAPLNDAQGDGKRKSYQVFIPQVDFDMAAVKDSLLEPGHIWSFPQSTKTAGELYAHARPDVEASVINTFL